MMSGNHHVEFEAFYPISSQGSTEGEEWQKIQNETFTQSKYKETNSSFEAHTAAVCLICMCCRASLRCSFQDSTVIPLLPLLPPCLKAVCSRVHQSQAVSVYVGACTEYKILRMLHKHSGDSGIGASPGLQRRSWEHMQITVNAAKKNVICYTEMLFWGI